MSQLHISKLRSSWPCIFAVSLCLVGQAQCADNIALAKAAVIDLYPELKGQDLHVGISEGGLLEAQGPLSDFVMLIQHSPRETLPAGQCPVPMLSIRFTFAVTSTDHQLFALEAGGTMVNDEKLKQMIDEVDSHKEWSDAEVSGALEKAGARFGPSAKKELLDKLPTEGLKLLLGDVRVDSVNFEIRNAAQAREHLPAATLFWTVRITARANNRELKYYILLEPFDGKVVSIGRIPPVL